MLRASVLTCRAALLHLRSGTVHRCDGCFEYDEENGDGQQRPSARKPIPGLVGLRVSGSWGEAGDKAHVVLCHGPPKGILDTVDTAVGTKAEPHRVEGRGIGSWRFRDKLEAVSPQVRAPSEAQNGCRRAPWLSAVIRFQHGACACAYTRDFC
jgi:hypothetical protein